MKTTSLSFIVETWEAISNIGVNDQLSFRERINTRMLNQLSAICLLLDMGLLLSFLCLPTLYLGDLLIVLMSVMMKLLAYFFHSQLWHFFTKVYAIVCAGIIISANTVYFGQAVRADYGYFIVAFLVIIFFDKTWQRIAIGFVVFLFFVAARFYLESFGAINELTEDPALLNSISQRADLAFATVTAVIVGLSSWYLNRLIHFQSQTEHLNKALSIKNQELERLAYVTTHDLKEPANTIASFTRLIEDSYTSQLPEESRPLFTTVSQTAQNMLQVISNLHGFLVLGKSAVLSLTDLNDSLEEAKSNLSEQIRARNVQISASRLPEIRCYPLEMRQLWQNLLSNAIKYSKENVKPKIHINFIDQEQFHEFEVVDNGIGIDSESVGKIFDVFQRLHLPSHSEGSGIGLATVKKVVEMHQGAIWVESQPGSGTSFHFTISKNLR